MPFIKKKDAKHRLGRNYFIPFLGRNTLIPQERAPTSASTPENYSLHTYLPLSPKGIPQVEFCVSLKPKNLQGIVIATIQVSGYIAHLVPYLKGPVLFHCLVCLPILWLWRRCHIFRWMWENQLYIWIFGEI